MFGGGSHQLLPLEYRAPFLRVSEAAWPRQPAVLLVPEEDTESKALKVERSLLVESDNDRLFRTIQNTSTWQRLRRLFAWLLKFKHFLMGKTCNRELRLFELQGADSALIRISQQDIKSHLENSSKKLPSFIRKLSPFINKMA